MRKSLFAKYIVICITIIIASMLFIGSIVIAFMTGFFRNYEYHIIESSVQNILDISKEVIRYNDITSDTGYVNVLSTIYKRYFGKGTQLVICDEYGKIYYHSEPDDITQTRAGFYVQQDVIDYIDKNGVIKQTGDFGGYFIDRYYIVGRSIENKPALSKMYIFMVSSADRFNNALGNIFNKFIFASVLAICFSFIVLLVVNLYLIKPLKKLVYNAKEYGKGNFAPKSNIYTQDEVGELAKAMDLMSKSLAQIEDSRRSFVANVSHELKTPMTIISGFVDGIIDGTIPQTSYNHYLNIISREIKRLSNLVQSMLNLSKIEGGNLDIKIEPVDIVGIIGNILIGFRSKIDDKNVVIKGMEIRDVWIEGDKGLIYQVFYNLIENAIKFVNIGGYIEFSFNKSGSSIEVKIKNSGEGLRDNEIEQLFNRFYKTDESRSNDTTGVGLGLNIVKTIVNLHDGDISVNSVYGKYTEFEVKFKTTRKKQKERKSKKRHDKD